MYAVVKLLLKYSSRRVAWDAVHPTGHGNPLSLVVVDVFGSTGA